MRGIGQSSVFLPREEIERVLGHQLALRAAQQWIDKTAKPIEVFTEAQDHKTKALVSEANIVNVDQATNVAIDSMKQQAKDEQTVNPPHRLGK
jgi:hypothetical protein